METKRLGERTITFSAPPAMIGFASVAGKKEGEGPLGNSFDYVAQDTTMSERPGKRPKAECSAKRLTAPLPKQKSARQTCGTSSQAT